MKNFIGFARKITIRILITLIATLPAHAGDKITYYHNDALGSPVAATNQLGQVIWRETYKPHGQRTTNATASANNKVWFTGKQEESALGINYFGARWYHPEIGRFLVIDPAGVTPENLYSFNRYAYANNNPLGFFDPDGRDSQEAAWAALGETPPSARLTQAAANVAQGGRVAAEVGDAMMPHNAVEAALPFALGKLLKLGKAANEIAPNEAQIQNLERFLKKIPSNAKDTVELKALPSGGVAAQATSAGRVPGSKAVYEKQIDSAGKTVQYTKTTYSPDGGIAHVKDKLNK